MLIREFTPADTEAVNAAALAAFAQYEGVYSDWETLTRGVGSMASLSNSAEIIVAEDEGQLLDLSRIVLPTPVHEQISSNQSGRSSEFLSSIVA